MLSAGVSRWLKIKDVKKLQQDIENDPIIKDQMAKLVCLLVCTFGNFLTPVLVATHTVKTALPSSSQPSQHEQNEDYEKGLKRIIFRHLSGWWDWSFPEDDKKDIQAWTFFVSGDWIQNFFNPKRTKIKMLSVMSFVFNAVELCIVTIDGKPWTRASEVCKALRYEKAAR